MRRIFFVTLFLFLAVSQQCVAQTDAEDLFVQANEEYTQQNFLKAIELYESVLNSGKESGPLYYNLGNAYFRMGNLGMAVLNYERALNVMPRDPVLRANYRYVRSLVGKIEGKNDVPLAAHFLSEMFGWQTFYEVCLILLMFIFFMTGLHLCSLFFQWKKRKRWAVLAVISSMIFLYTFGLFIKIQHVFGMAVILSDSSVYFEPRDGATVHFPVFEGNKVKVLGVQKTPGWEKIQRFDGKIGWVKAEDIERILIKRWRRVPGHV